MILYLREGKLLEAKTMYDKTDKTLGTFVSYILFNCTKTTKINYVLRIIAFNSWILDWETRLVLYFIDCGHMRPKCEENFN